MDEKLTERQAAEAIVQKPIDFNLSFKNRTTVMKRKIMLKKKFPFISIEKREEVIDFPDIRHFKVFPPTLGKMEILSSLFLQLDIDFDKFTEDPSTELFKCCSAHSNLLAKIMAVAITEKKENLLDECYLEKEADFFRWHCTSEDFSIMLGAMLAQIDLVNFSNSIRLTKLFRLNAKRKSN